MSEISNADEVVTTLDEAIAEATAYENRNRLYSGEEVGRDLQQLRDLVLRVHPEWGQISASGLIAERDELKKRFATAEDSRRLYARAYQIADDARKDAEEQRDHARDVAARLEAENALIVGSYGVQYGEDPTEILPPSSHSESMISVDVDLAPFKRTIGNFLENLAEQVRNG